MPKGDTIRAEFGAEVTEQPVAQLPGARLQ
jgi:hypothetical protein